MANAKDWTLAGLDTMALFEYMRNGHKHEDLSVLITNLVRDSMLRVLRVYEVQQGWQPSDVASILVQGQQLYYRMLQYEMQTLYPATKQGADGRHCQRVTPAGAHTVLQRMELHLGLLHCTLEVLLTSSCPGAQALVPNPNITRLLETEHLMPAVWEASRWFIECFTSETSGCTMSEALLARLRRVKVVCEESLVLAEGSAFYELVFTGGGCAYPQADMRLISALLADLARGVLTRVVQCVHGLHANGVLTQFTLTQAEAQQSLQDAALLLADQVLSGYLHLFFDVHQAVVVACIVYGSARALLFPNVNFNAVTTCLLSHWEGLQPHTFTAIRVHPQHDWRPQPVVRASSAPQATRSSRPEICNVRAFYNAVFLPACEPLLKAIKPGSAPQQAAQAAPQAVAEPVAQQPPLAPAAAAVALQPARRTPLQDVSARALEQRLNVSPLRPPQGPSESPVAAWLTKGQQGGALKGAATGGALGDKENVAPKGVGAGGGRVTAGGRAPGGSPFVVGVR